MPSTIATESSAQLQEQLLRDFQSLPPELKERVARFARALTKPKRPPGAKGRDLRQLAGSLDEESAREMIEVIEEGCEQVDPHG